MKSEKGVTLISLIVYIIVFTIVVGIVAIMTRYFYKNIRDTNEGLDPLTQFTTFNSFFAEEVNDSNIQIIDCKSSYVIFGNEGNKVQYTFANNSIYRDRAKICRNIEECTFTAGETENGKQTIEVKFKAINGEERTQKYTLKNW